jgi:hypothetical protein
MFFPTDYTIAIGLFPKLLGLIYFVAFGAFLFQIKGLLAENGILPVSTFLSWVKRRFGKRSYWLVLSLLWLRNDNRALMGLIIAGILCSLGLMLGASPPFFLALVFVLYLSLVSVGQDFLSFGWESFLLEITFNAFFLSLTTSPNMMIWISINLLLFRFHFEGGVVKLLSKDPNWRNLTGVAYHYQSQPIPNTIAWYAHKLPMWFQKASTLIMLVIEIIVPFGIAGNEPIRMAVFGAFFSLQFFIWLTGNFSFLNHLTVVFSTLLIGNRYLSPFFQTPDPSTSPEVLDLLCTTVGTALVILQTVQIWQHFVHNPLIHSWLRHLSPLHIINRYGIFAVMTTTRNEVVFEGSSDGVNWKEYTFFYKPSDIKKRPRRISPYQPRIDWQAWFLPLGGYRYDPWFEGFIYCLLKGTPEVLSLIEYNPFPEKPPRYIRTLMYEYQFSSAEEKKKHGWWWRREYRGIFTHPVSLGSGRQS